MSSLRDHFERVRAEKAARQANADPRLSTHGRQLNRPLGSTMTRQKQPVFDGQPDGEYPLDDDNPDAGSPIELKFFNDWQSLQGIQSQAKKNELKADFLPYYLPWIVSIHAPVWGATKSTQAVQVLSQVSIHAPVWGATPCLSISKSIMRFNPRTRVGCDE